MLSTTRFSQGRIRLLSSRLLSSKIVYTETDEAPMLATYSLLPIVQTFASKANIAIEKADISLAGRILAQFPERLTPEQRVPDYLSNLGELAKTPSANIIKLPNISASIPQLNAAIAELREKGYNVPLYNPNPQTPEEKEVFQTYAKVLGSAVNPVLREGNSDRRVATPVKNYAKKNPHKLGAWSKDSKSHVAHMNSGDFYGSEISTVIPNDTQVKIEFQNGSEKKVLKGGLKLLKGEVIDASFLNVNKLQNFIEQELNDCKDKNLLFSVHLKATMMKISDPVLFGHFIKVYYKKIFEKHGDLLAKIGYNPNNGLADLLNKVKTLSEDEQKQFNQTLDEVYASRPGLAMVDSGKGITNLHMPNDVIIDASMPVVVRDSGKMWNKDNQLQDVKCVIPDRCYATAYREIMDYCRENGQFNVTTMGSVSNVGLMAKKAEEYGSHDKTFIAPANGTISVIDENTGKQIFQHNVEAGDIWRMCQTKDDAIKDWVRLAVQRARLSGHEAIFWLDSNRGHDASIIAKVNEYLKDHDTKGLSIHILPPVEAMRRTCQRVTAGQDTISVTGNVFRDYLTDLFPILELGTSSKMLSIVPLLAGGGLFETGAGGSAPKHVQQFLSEGHLRWDSLGEYLAIAVSFEHLAETTNNAKAKELAKGLNEAIERLLDKKRSPSRKVGEPDNRAANFYIALYWADAMAQKDPAFASLSEQLKKARSQIVEELKVAQGHSVDIGGYYKVDEAKANAELKPSKTLNKILESQF